MSPKRESPSTAPDTFQAAPLSLTSPTLMLVFATHDCMARRMLSRAALPDCPDRRAADRLLPTPWISVPSWTKLIVRFDPSGQGFQKVAGRARSSSRSTLSRVGGRIRVGLGRAKRLDSTLHNQ